MHDMGGLVEFATSLISNETLVLHHQPLHSQILRLKLRRSSLESLLAHWRLHYPKNLFKSSRCVLCGAHQHRRDVYTTSSPNRSRYVRPSCTSAHVLYTRHSLTVTPGKRIALPTRVEPKVFFANERTFLSWLNFTVILGGLAIGLLNFGDKVGKISAGLFTLVAMMAMVYALFTFHWRARSIRMRGQGGFDDRLGPTILTITLFAAVIVNFVLRLTMGNGK
jgi:uncharacterized membrane protein YidH (DUF202 family)